MYLIFLVYAFLYITILEIHFLAFKILVKIESAGVNPVDTYIREGAFLNLPDLPFIPGKDGAGIIQKVGEDVKTFQVYCDFISIFCSVILI